MGGAAAAAMGAAGPGGHGAAHGGIHPYVHQLWMRGGAGGGDMGGNDAWIRGASQEQLSVWGVQPPPGLARQYATTRHADRGAGGMVSAFGG